MQSSFFPEVDMTMRRLAVIIFLLAAGCSDMDPCDQCYDMDYYYEHPYFCHECLQEKGDTE
ncbi:MAG TPA: hypothetical protein PLP82_07140 [Deltaproteobacteria bacterium]|nr:hypothetical protein [Deltaproteobacteria bacterium]HOY73848.1 hypothetical protein [Deltaproteobacteria bacterium]HPH51658.1 hypothetical protein [Deltaproteobacteria bacterium]HPO40033.1 hypothetical protein [Bacteroidales bacterium]HPR03662.1 hypothetical protein [Deltaproteobacteria bacterium]